MAEDKSKLNETQIGKALTGLKGWCRNGVHIQKSFIFENYAQINRFLPHLTKTIVEQNHHPDFAFTGHDKQVFVKVTTHSKGGLTKADFDLAEALDSWESN